MRSNQREAVLVLLNVFDRNLPAFDGMAVFTLRAHLPAMDVRVTLRAFVPHVGEHRLHVALRARNFCVHASQWVRRLVVIKIRHRSNRLPAQIGMARLAGNIERAVGTPR